MQPTIRIKSELPVGKQNIPDQQNNQGGGEEEGGLIEDLR